MNIDEHIKKELESEIHDLGSDPGKQQGLFSMVASAYQGGLGRWVIAVSIITLCVSALLVWSGYEFFTATTLNAKVHWGYCLTITLVAQIALKQWTWMEMNRNSLLREIKRLEVAVGKLNPNERHLG